MLWAIRVFETSKGLAFTKNGLGIQVDRFEAISCIQKLKMGQRDTGRKEEVLWNKYVKKILIHSFIYRNMSLSLWLYFLFVLQTSFT